MDDTPSLTGTTSSITIQSLGKIVQRAPAVSAEMWFLLVLFVTHNGFFNTHRARGDDDPQSQPPREEAHPPHTCKGPPSLSGPVKAKTQGRGPAESRPETDTAPAQTPDPGPTKPPVRPSRAQPLPLTRVTFPSVSPINCSWKTRVSLYRALANV